MANKFQKRLMKLRGLGWYVFSLIMLRYTRSNEERLAKQIKKVNIQRLHVGCGNVWLASWLNILFERRQEYGRIKIVNGTLVLNYNLLKSWPVESDSIQLIAGSHFIEHLDLNEGMKFVAESFRVLKKGGRLRLSCPDMELYARHYVNNNQKFFDHPLIREWCTFKAAQTPGQIFIAKAYDSGGAHRWFYDFASLKNILERAGFVEIKKVSRLEGQIPDLEKLEPPPRELETLYVEAVKP